MKKISYYQQLLDPRWQRKRLEVLQRDGFKCLICKSEKDSLEVHHEKYVNEPWDVDNKYLKTLCFRCHDVVEICKKNKVKYVNFNRVPLGHETFIYLVNSKVNGKGVPGKYVFVIHNIKGKFEPIQMYFPKELVEYMLQTF